MSVDVGFYAHVEGSGVELVDFFSSSSDASGGEDGCHGVAYGFLCGGEGWVCFVGSAECVGGLLCELVVDGFQVVRWEYAV